MKDFWRDWPYHPVGVLVILIAFVSTMALTGVGLSSCAGTRPVTVGGIPTTSETTQQAANRIYNAETAFVLAGEALLVLRGHGGPLYGPDYDTRWAQIAEASDKFTKAIGEAKAALLEYEAQRSDATSTALTDSLSWLDYMARRLLAYTGEE